MNFGSKFLNYNNLDNELKQDWREKKAFGRYLYKSYKRLGFDDKYKKVKFCGYRPDFDHYVTGEFRLKNVQFCKDRLCPVCAWRRSRKMFSQTLQVVNSLEGKCKYIMLTLTVKNVPADQLASKLDQMQHAFSKLRKLRPFKRICLGFYKALEITYNKQSNTFHPHYHILIAVPLGYGMSNSAYLTKNDFRDMWSQCLDDPDSYIVNVKAVYKKSGSVGYASSVAEIAKYTVKPSSYLFKGDNYITDYVVYVLTNVLYKRRLVSYGGIFRDARSELDLDDVIDGDLIHTGESDVESDIDAVYKFQWSWASLSYELIGVHVFSLDRTFLRCDLGFYDYDTGVLLE